jgi:hypothetical protein
MRIEEGFDVSRKLFYPPLSPLKKKEKKRRKEMRKR